MRTPGIRGRSHCLARRSAGTARAAAIGFVAALALVDAAPGLGGPYESRYVEAEQMNLQQFRRGRNPWSSYSGHHEFALALVHVKEGQARKAETMALSTVFGRPLPPGKYQVFVDYIDACRVRLSMGGATVQHDLPAGQRTDAIEITTREPAPGFSCQVVQHGPRVIFDWFFITNDPAYALAPGRKGKRVVGKPDEPSEPLVPAEDAPNLIANGSFEAGAPLDWTTPYQGNLALYGSMLDRQQKSHGTSSLKVPVNRQYRNEQYTGSQMSYDRIPLRQGKSYRLSFRAKSDAETQISVELKIAGAKKGFSRKAALGPDWQEVAMDLGPLAADGWGRLSLSFAAKQGCHAWLDAFHLGPVTPPQAGGIAEGRFVPKTPLEAGPVWTRPANIMIAGQDRAEVAVWKEATAPADARFQYQVFDVDDRRVAEQTMDLADAPAGASSRALALPGDTPGCYRMLYRTICGRQDAAWRQVGFSVLPDASTRGDGPIGLYGSLAPQALEVFEIAGFRWTNTLSAAGQIGTWPINEPKYGGGFLHFDEDWRHAHQRRVDLLVTLHTVPYSWPQGLPFTDVPPAEPWVRHKEKGYFPLAAWVRYVGDLARQYRGRIRHWLVIDEPNSQYAPEEYLKLIAATYESLKKADPQNLVFFHTHLTLGAFEKLEPEKYCDGIYDYVRERPYAEKLLAWCRKHDKPLWTVEYGGFRSLQVDPEQGPLDDPYGTPVRENVHRAVLSALRSLAWPHAQRYFRYDARFQGHRGHMTLFDADGTLKPAGVALAVLNGLLAGLRGNGEAELPKPLQGFLFEGKDKVIVALQHADGGAVRVRLAIDQARLALFDVMGRPVRAEPAQGKLEVLVDMLPKYLVCDARDGSMLVDALRTAEVCDAFTLESRLVRDARQPVTLELVVRSTMRERVDATLAPESASLFHCDGFSPVERFGLARQLRSKAVLAPGGAAKVQYVLGYPADKQFPKDAASCRFGLVVSAAGLTAVLPASLDQVGSAAEVR